MRTTLPTARLMISATAMLLAPVLGRAAAPFPLLEDERQAVIVGNGHLVQKVVEQCTGVRLEHVSEAAYRPQPDRFPLYVGCTRKAEELLAHDIATLDAEGYIILVEPTRAVIYAPVRTTDTGEPNTWAQADFLRRCLGAEDLIPGQIGAHRPKHKRVLVPTGKWVENPAFKHRHWSGYAGSAGPSWRVRASGGGGRYRYHHNLYRIIKPDVYRDHPDYFPVVIPKHKQDQKGRGLHRHLKPGQRYVPTERFAAYWQPCTSHPDVVDIITDAAIEYLDANPNDKAFSLGINDSSGFCYCEKCLAEAPPDVEPDSRAAVGYRFYRFYNTVAERVAKKHPDARLGFLVYSALNAWYPDRLHPLLMPYLTMSMADRWDPEYRKQQNEHIRRWSGIARQFGIYEWLFGRGFFIPRIYAHDFADGLRFAHECGAEGFYAEAYANWGLDGPKLWVAERLLWQPDQDVDQLLDRWHTAMFAAAADPMRAYFDYLEHAWRTQKQADDRRGGYRLLGSHFKARQYTDVFPPPACEEAWRLLDRADAAARQPLVKQRIAYYRTAFGATRIASNRYAAAESLTGMLDIDRKTPIPLSRWLSRLDDWARFGSLDDYMAPARQTAPWAFQEFAMEHFQKDTHYSFAQWDSDAPVLRHVVNRLMNSALSPETGAAPRTQAAMDEACDRLLAEIEDAPAAKRVVRRLAKRATMTIRTLATAPAIDGRIEDVWGEPSFDGRLFAYPHEDTEAEARTTIWCARQNGRLYVAFRCEQDPKTINTEPVGRDQVIMTERNTVNPGDGQRDFPYITGGDSVGVTLPGRLSATVIVTASGGLFDGYGSPYGFKIDWNGAEAKTQIGADGWTAEIAVTPKEKSPFIEGSDDPVHGFNFIRIDRKKRTAWVPAMPRRWSIHPRTAGFGFFIEE
ncbi:MAG: DUF4838 domain-containing protein [Planctomycetes bacterium]|nr:DUF4838 domain-containing protein [Planctomycetota bacterium]MBL7041401.1 DUF4838 domain-containing protein [Pirellulaceae bacterium]